MFWSLSLSLMPDEKILEDSTAQIYTGLKPTYSVYLTNKRAIFKMNGLGSAMTQSFLYQEITGAQPSSRMFINYLRLQTEQKEHYLHVPESAYWAGKINGLRKTLSASNNAEMRDDDLGHRKKQDLHDMLRELRKNNILNEAEFEQKTKLVDETVV